MIRSGTHGNWQGLAEPIKAPRLSTARRIISLSFLIILSWGFKFSLAAQETSGGGASFLERLNQNQVIHSQSQQFQVIEPPITAKNIKDPENLAGSIMAAAVAVTRATGTKEINRIK